MDQRGCWGPRAGRVFSDSSQPPSASAIRGLFQWTPGGAPDRAGDPRSPPSAAASGAGTEGPRPTGRMATVDPAPEFPGVGVEPLRIAGYCAREG